jgi:hypothetical protein
MKYEEASQGHASAGVNAPTTRDANAERGVGRAFRHEADTLPIVPVQVRTQQAGMSAIRASRAGPARREDRGVLGRTGSHTVAVRSGNVDPSAIGINKSNWGIAGDGDAPAPVPSTAPAQSKLFLIGGLAALAACFLLFKKG